MKKLNGYEIYDFLMENLTASAAHKQTDTETEADAMVIPSEKLAWDILQKEKKEAAEVLKRCDRSFHYGYKNSLISKGYDADGCDSYTNFRKKGGLFWFKVCQWNDWKISNTVGFEIPSTKYASGLESINLSCDNEWAFARTWKRYGLTSDNLKPKRPKETVYTSYDVCDSGTSYYSERHIKTFATFDEAKKFAYEYAQKKCDRGRERQDSTRRYFNSSPWDGSKFHKPLLAYYEYYSYNETSFGIYVEGVR